MYDTLYVIAAILAVIGNIIIIFYHFRTTLCSWAPIRKNCRSDTYGHCLNDNKSKKVKLVAGHSGQPTTESYIIRCYYIVPWWQREEDCSCAVIIVIKKPYVCRTGHVSVNLARRIKTVMSTAALEWANFLALGPFTMLYIKTNRS